MDIIFLHFRKNQVLRAIYQSIFLFNSVMRRLLKMVIANLSVSLFSFSFFFWETNRYSQALHVLTITENQCCIRSSVIVGICLISRVVEVSKRVFKSLWRVYIKTHNWEENKLITQRRLSFWFLWDFMVLERREKKINLVFFFLWRANSGFFMSYYIQG